MFHSFSNSLPHGFLLRIVNEPVWVDFVGIVSVRCQDPAIEYLLNVAAVALFHLGVCLTLRRNVSDEMGNNVLLQALAISRVKGDPQRKASGEGEVRSGGALSKTRTTAGAVIR